MTSKQEAKVAGAPDRLIRPAIDGCSISFKRPKLHLHVPQIQTNARDPEHANAPLAASVAPRITAARAATHQAAAEGFRTRYKGLKVTLWVFYYRF